MKDAVATPQKTSERPEFLWDPLRARLLWANDVGLKFWGETSLTDLAERWFVLSDATSSALTALKSKGSGPIELSPKGVPITHHATATDENGVWRIILNDLETPSHVYAPQMSDGFELAPRPLAIFDAVGGLITQNEADRLCFGPLSLADRLGDADTAAQVLGVALVDESYSGIFSIGADSARWRGNFRRLRGRDGAVAVLAEFSDIPPALQDSGVDRMALAAIAHDFRAPLTAIRGFAEFLASGAASAERQADYLAAIQTAAIGLNALADRFVALGQSGDAPLGLVDLNNLARSSADLNQAAAANVATRVDFISDPVAQPVISDPVAATRIIQNLVSNAVRHGGDIVTIVVSGETLTITDNGAGMDQDALDAALSASDGPNADVSSSTGLGLSNCVQLAASMAASIEFTTAPGKGLSARISFVP